MRCADLAQEGLDAETACWAEAVGVSVPMHTAMRLAVEVARQLRSERDGLPIALYGLYATLNESDLFDIAISGEYLSDLVSWVDRLERSEVDDRDDDRNRGGRPTVVSLRREKPGLPARHLLPPLDRYAKLSLCGEERLAGYVEASHGCAHRCRHCPVPVVYDGRTRLVHEDVLLADVDQLVRMGARHITFGDPDFLNGPHHARRQVTAFHDAFPELTFDITVKVEHILRYRNLLPDFGRCGCLFAVSAFESADDDTLRRLDKGHSVADELEAVAVLRKAGIEPRPSLLPFTPWTRAEHLVDLIDLVARADLIGNVDPIQYSIRLLVPPGSLLLTSGHLDGYLDYYDPGQLGWTWRSSDPRLDALQQRLADMASSADTGHWSAMETYEFVRQAVAEAISSDVRLGSLPDPEEHLRSTYEMDLRPRLTESWFCCAEPTAQMISAQGGA